MGSGEGSAAGGPPTLTPQLSTSNLMCTASKQDSCFTSDQTGHLKLRKQIFGLNQNLGHTMDSATRWRNCHHHPRLLQHIPTDGKKMIFDCKSYGSQITLSTHFMSFLVSGGYPVFLWHWHASILLCTFICDSISLRVTFFKPLRLHRSIKCIPPGLQPI